MKLYFQKLGSGPALFILHGLYGSSDNWVTFGRKLANQFTVYLIDQRNHGRSPHDTIHTYPAMANDLNELFIAENLDKSIVMGHSMGGKTAMLFTAMFPEKVQGLIAVDIAPVAYSHLDQYSAHSIFHLNMMNAMQSLDFQNYNTRGAIESELAKTIHDSTIRQFIMKNIHRNEHNLFCWKINLDVLCKSLPYLLGDIHLEKIATQKTIPEIPVLFIRGEDSDYILPEHFVSIRSFFENAEIETISNAGHWVHAEQPERFWEVLSNFLRKFIILQKM